MILADKILTLRKDSGLSQEELAERLHVSRQSISKWESAASIPDIDKIIDMSKLFGVTTDYLLKDDIEHAAYTNEEADAPRKISLEEANAFLTASAANARKIALGVLLCILSPILLITLPVLATEVPAIAQSGAITEEGAVGIGIVALLLLVASAVAIFIVSDTGMRRYRNIDRGAFELAYGVEGVLRERWREREPRHTLCISAGVVMCILCPVPLITAGLAGASDLVCVLCTALLLAIVAVAVYLFISASSDKECCDKLLREDDFAAERANANKRNEKISGIYWPIVTVAYLAWSFLSERWDITWLVWPIAGVLFGAVCAIINACAKE